MVPGPLHSWPPLPSIKESPYCVSCTFLLRNQIAKWSLWSFSRTPPPPKWSWNHFFTFLFLHTSLIKLKIILREGVKNAPRVSTHIFYFFFGGGPQPTLEKMGQHILNKHLSLVLKLVYWMLKSSISIETGLCKPNLVEPKYPRTPLDISRYCWNI